MTKKFFSKNQKNCLDICAKRYYNIHVVDETTRHMRVCWNRQTGTFEGRVSMTYGFKSHHSHQRTLATASVLFYCATRSSVNGSILRKEGAAIGRAFYIAINFSSPRSTETLPRLISNTFAEILSKSSDGIRNEIVTSAP